MKLVRMMATQIMAGILFMSLSAASQEIKAKMLAVDEEIANSEITVNATESVNAAPTIISQATAGPDDVAVGGSTILSVVAEDPNGDELSYAWELSDGPGAVSFAHSSQDTAHVSDFSAAGRYDFLVLVSDGFLASESQVTVTIQEEPSNVPPSISFTSPSGDLVVDVGTEVPILGSAADADGTIVQIELLLNSWTFFVQEGDTLDFPLILDRAGTHTLSLVATDDKGDTSRVSISVQVKDGIDTGPKSPPEVSLVGIEGDVIVGTGTVISVNAEASDTDGWVTRVELFVDGFHQGTLFKEPYVFDDVVLGAQGAYTFKVVATDNHWESSEVSTKVTARDDIQPGNPGSASDEGGAAGCGLASSAAGRSGTTWLIVLVILGLTARRRLVRQS